MGENAHDERKTNRKKTTCEKYWRRKKRRLSTSEVRSALSSPSNQLIIPCLCYWSLLCAPFFLFPLAELIRTVNAVYNFSSVGLLTFDVNRQLRRRADFVIDSFFIRTADYPN
jgi:hypothetical protein